MKKLVCEMCGSTNLIKQDGVFVCQDCGTKYSVEEARKMMVEGTVDVTGSTVKVDTSAELSNLYQIARRAKDDNNSENAAKYYDMILVKDPTSWEASFYVVYFKAMSCKIAQIRSAAISVANCQESVLKLIKNNVVSDEQASAVKEVETRSAHIANLLANGAKNHFDGISLDIKSNYVQEYVDNVCAARDIMYTCGTQIDTIFADNNDIAKYAADAWKSGIKIHTQVLPNLANKTLNQEMMISYAKKIAKYDDNYSKTYVYDEKKKMLETEISTLKKRLDQAKSKSESSKEGYIIGGIVAILFGIGMILYTNKSGIADGITLGISVFVIICGALMILGGLTYRSSKQIESERENLVTSLSNQIEIKQKELDELSK